MTKMLSKVFHTLVVFYYLYVLNGLFQISKITTPDGKVHQVKDLCFRYMTNWNVGIQVIFFASCFLYDVIEKIGMRKWKSTLKNLQDYWFFTICVPNAFFVAISFWTLHLYDSKTIFAVPVNMIMPDWLNHAIHTTVVPLVFIEMLLVYRQTPALRRPFVTYVSFVGMYGLCLLETYIEQGVWVYPLFKDISHIQRLLVLLGFLLAGVISFLFACLSKLSIDRVIFSHEIHTSKKKLR